MRRRDLKGAAVDLADSVIDDLVRVTPPARVAAALEALGEAGAAFTDGRYKAATRYARTAKELSPRDVTVREILGLASYRVGDWPEALRELRTYRRLTGDTTHMPTEMDVLRALDRPDDVASAWKVLKEKGGKPSVMKEGKVVYASHLMDRGKAAAAWELTNPKKLVQQPAEADLRVWYVAARAAAVLGDTETASQIRNAILRSDPGFPGIDELESIISSSSR